MQAMHSQWNIQDVADLHSHFRFETRKKIKIYTKFRVTYTL